ncbi:uncharacterized protein [Ptychodera flava]|uniref:uncharacterized protein n=1 Tax=Ptychodera flava TaxID=63121 RepID=UPI00396AADE8
MALPAAVLTLVWLTMVGVMTSVHRPDLAQVNASVLDVLNWLLTASPVSMLNLPQSSAVMTYSCHWDVDALVLMHAWVPPTASDNCGLVHVTASHDESFQFPPGSTEVIFTATDAAGLTAQCSIFVNVQCSKLSISFDNQKIRNDQNNVELQNR